MTTAEPDWDRVGYVTASQYREIVLLELRERPQKPTDLATATDCDIANISRALTQLADEGVVDLLVSEDRKKGRIYGLTDAGERVAEYLGNGGGGA